MLSLCPPRPRRSAVKSSSLQRCEKDHRIAQRAKRGVETMLRAPCSLPVLRRNRYFYHKRREACPEPTSKGARRKKMDLRAKREKVILPELLALRGETLRVLHASAVNYSGFLHCGGTEYAEPPCSRLGGENIRPFVCFVVKIESYRNCAGRTRSLRSLATGSTGLSLQEICRSGPDLRNFSGQRFGRRGRQR